jgi:hypothetical protein
MNLGGCVDAFWIVASLSQHVGQGHGEAAGVGGADQFLGIGTATFLKAGGEGVLALIGPTAELHIAFALGQFALPYSFCST